MIPDELRARYRAAKKIRDEGAIGNLFDGVSITAHGLDTRLLAWPGTGYQTESVHVTTVKPGQQSDRYTYDLAEEAILCRYGTAEVWLRDRWVILKPGDMAYIPEGVERQIRNPATNGADAILVNQICPPQFDLYADRSARSSRPESRSGRRKGQGGTVQRAYGCCLYRDRSADAPCPVARRRDSPRWLQLRLLRNERSGHDPQASGFR